MAGKRKAGTPNGRTRPSGRSASAAPAKKSPAKAGAKPPGQPPRGKNGKKGKKPRTRGQKVRRVLLYFVVAGLVCVLIAGGAFAYLYKTTKLPDPNADFETNTSFVYYSDGKTELGRYAIQNRDAISYDDMPQDVKDAVVAAENRSFWSDNGIDVKGIARAVFNNASGNATQGASTITQQYIKILYLTQERSYTRKLKEAILSLKLGKERSKQQILEGYLNTIYFGRGAYGIQAAAEAYFEKDAGELTLQESAALASIINNPSHFDPANGKESKIALRERYRYVLDGMAQADDITADEAAQASKRLPKFPPVVKDSTYGGQKGHVLAMVKSQLLELKDEAGRPLLTDDQIDGGGLRVTTTFTKRAMDAAEAGVAEVKPKGPEIDKQLHVGVASVQVDTGAIRGIYGGQDYLESQINWAEAGGMAGSSMKPFALAAGIKAGFSLKDTFDGNSPFELPDGAEIENEGDTDYGSAVNLIKATEDSINTAYTDLTVSIPDGPQEIMSTMNAMGIPPEKPTRKYDYGFPDHTPGLKPFPSITLGTATVSPINMANGYATIANGGRFHAPYIIEKVVDQDGETLYDHSVSDKQAIDDEQGSDIAADVSYAMQQVVQAGSGTAALELGQPAAGKTGTATVSNGDVSSSWFTGFTPQPTDPDADKSWLATSVMYVRGKGTGKLDGWLPTSDDGRQGYFGGNYPAKTWTAVMTKDLEDIEVGEFPDPVYVDGEAPTEGHQPTLPPSPTKKPTPSNTPSNTGKPTKSPSIPGPPSDTPSSTPPAPPPSSSAPPPSPTDTPTQPPSCDPVTCPTLSATPPAARIVATGASSVAWWDRMRW
ncbi:MAG TPA: penicillin-binding protein [Nocardioides bacterium]|uniref:transglycosylase domain-containing protein n=1 Tax=uncultured Nocardioides sp. TaxID=198441 RepID=UPI000ECE0EE8|nr:transglycosylase domain-containing protein [uncultured Nocardioides sp.]HCB06046.1 penicillin-binding protein [Nocardioides sp.]HRD62862.1 transglycosylase domain-containing protein [Nocardioides sp.]